MLFGKQRITFEKYDQLIAPIETAKASIQRKIDKINMQLDGLITTQESADRLCGLVRQVRTNIDRGVTLATKRQIMNLLDVEVTLVMSDGDKFVDMVCYLTLDNKRLRLSGIVCQDSFTECSIT